MVFNINKEYFQIYSPWKKHRMFESLQIHLVVYLLIFYILTPPHGTYSRSTGSISPTAQPDSSNTVNTTEQTTHGLSRFILDMYEALNGNNRASQTSGNIFYSRFVGPEQMKLVHSADTIRSFYPQSTFDFNLNVN